MEVQRRVEQQRKIKKEEKRGEIRGNSRDCESKMTRWELLTEKGCEHVDLFAADRTRQWWSCD